MKEHQHTEWKESWREDYLRWVCGFANSRLQKYRLTAQGRALLEDLTLP